MRFVHWRGAGLAVALTAAMVAGLVSAPGAQAGGWYHWWNGHTINGRATPAKDFRTGGVYYAPPIPYGEYTKNYTACIHEAAGAAHGLVGKVCGYCKGLGCKMCGYLGCLHGLICGGCNGAGCGSCGGSGITTANTCGNCGGKGCGNCGGRGILAGNGAGLGSHFGHGLDLQHGGTVAGPGVATVGAGLADPTCGLCGFGKGSALGHHHGAVASAAALPSAQSTPSAQALPSAQAAARRRSSPPPT